MFTGTLMNCRISEFADIKDERTGDISHFAIIQEQWGESKWVKLLDPSQAKSIPVLQIGTATFELKMSGSAVIREGNNGKDRAKNEVNIKILSLLDFKVDQPVHK